MMRMQINSGYGRVLGDMGREGRERHLRLDVESREKISRQRVQHVKQS